MATSKGGRRAQQKHKEEDVALVNVSLEHFRPIFNEYGSQGIPLREVREKLAFANNGEELPADMQRRLVDAADRNEDGRLTYTEFYNLMTTGEGRHYVAIPLTKFQTVVRTAVSTVVPGSHKKMTDEGEKDYAEDYAQHYNCCPPPLFMLIISLIELGIFVGYAIHQQNTYGVPTTMISGAPRYSPLIYIPARRYEAWRFASYMFIHDGIKHLISNLIFQLLIGIPLELVHKFWRVGIVYILGVIAGSLATSVVDPWTLLCGASGGCYALIGAHFAIIIMNWQDMTHDWMSGPVKFLLSAPVQLAFWTLYAAVDTGVAIYSRYFAETHTAYAAHFAGALAGVLIGIPVLKNFKVLPWERVVFWVALSLYVVLTIFSICFNIFYRSHYPETDWRACCPVPSYYHRINATAVKPL